jgi:dGTPase
MIKDLAPKEMPTMETQIVDIADEIAYDNHDLDDGLTSGLINEEDLKGLSIWNKINSSIPEKYAGIPPEKKKYMLIRNLINTQVTDLIDETEKKVRELKLRSPADVKKMGHKIIAFSPSMQLYRKPLRLFLMEKLYHHYRVVRMTDKAKRFIKELFQVYMSRPEALNPQVQKRIKIDGARKAICDYIAGMTDRNALDEYKKLFDPYSKV